MTSSNGNIFRVTGPLCGEFIGPGDFPAQRPVTRSFAVFFEAGDLWRRRGHYDISVMITSHDRTHNAQCDRYKQRMQ